MKVHCNISCPQCKVKFAKYANEVGYLLIMSGVTESYWKRPNSWKTKCSKYDFFIYFKNTFLIDRAAKPIHSFSKHFLEKYFVADRDFQYRNKNSTKRLSRNYRSVNYCIRIKNSFSVFNYKTGKRRRNQWIWRQIIRMIQTEPKREKIMKKMPPLNRMF